MAAAAATTPSLLVLPAPLSPQVCAWCCLPACLLHRVRSELVTSAAACTSTVLLPLMAAELLHLDRCMEGTAASAASAALPMCPVALPGASAERSPLLLLPVECQQREMELDCPATAKAAALASSSAAALHVCARHVAGAVAAGAGMAIDGDGDAGQRATDAAASSASPAAGARCWCCCSTATCAGTAMLRCFCLAPCRRQRDRGAAAPVCHGRWYGDGVRRRCCGHELVHHRYVTDCSVALRRCPSCMPLAACCGVAYVCGAVRSTWRTRRPPVQSCALRANACCAASCRRAHACRQ